MGISGAYWMVASCDKGKYPGNVVIFTSAPTAIAPALNALSTFKLAFFIASIEEPLTNVSIVTISGT